MVQPAPHIFVEAPPKPSMTAESPSRAPERDPYIVQVGFDFGTSYCKCVCRDINLDKAWVHVPENPASQEYPFLMPSALQVHRNDLVIADPTSHYHPDGLPHVKRALVKIALKEWDDPVLVPFQKIIGDGRRDHLASFVAVCAVYLLAGALGGIRRQIRLRCPGFDESQDDYMAVNLAIPVADADQPEVNGLFQRVLSTALHYADHLAGHPPLPRADLEKSVSRWPVVCSKADTSNNGQCFIYPEVSAEVQGLVRSRVSEDRSRIYVFSDTGAATVDQSVFILWRRQDVRMLTYLYAGVLPLGSSEIEYRAASMEGDVNWQNLERWRKKKETGDIAPDLQRARVQIGHALTEKTAVSLIEAKRKLNQRNIERQLQEIRVMFGGGGHSTDPYEMSVLRAFDDERVFGIRPPKPDVVGMPLPADLEPSESLPRWMPRLWVAYGLSFHKLELAEHMYPSQVSEGRPIRRRPDIDPPRQEDV